MRADSTSLFSKLARHRGDLSLLAEAVAWLLAARVMLILLPFRRVMKLSVGRHDPTPTPSTGDHRIIQRVRWAVTAAARRVPWRAVCIHQGIAAQRLLLRRGVGADLVYGVAKRDDGTIEAHVWAKVAGVTVVGGAVAVRFVPLAVFKGGSGIAAFDPPDEAPGGQAPR